MCFPFDVLHDVGVIDPGYDEAGTPLEAAAELAYELDPGDAWTLTQIAGRITCGWTLADGATAAGITLFRAKRQLDDLQDPLADLSPAPCAPERWTRIQRPKALA